jgi:hypothetical protein
LSAFQIWSIAQKITLSESRTLPVGEKASTNRHV